jgi:hypothetical protein
LIRAIGRSFHYHSRRWENSDKDGSQHWPPRKLASTMTSVGNADIDRQGG